ncbi:MAG TPA: diguanylate cyclase [Coriobacteriia bacterium]|nr:diguanylate cyclase [Coriobacteriia bacterium]
MSRGRLEAIGAGALPDAEHAKSNARRLRTLAWAALPILAAAYYALLISPLPPFARLVVLELVYCTPIVLTVIWGLKARSLSEGQESTFWGAVAGANATLLLCEVLLVYWVGVISPAGPPRVSWPFHILHAFAAVFFLVGATALSRWHESPAATKYRWTMDLSSVLLVALVLLLEFYVRPIMEPAGATMPEVFLGAAYPLFALLMLIGTVGNVAGFKVDRWRTWDRLFAISLTIYAVAICLWPVWYPTALDTSRNYERGVLDLVQFSGHWLLMAAAVYRLTEVAEWKLRPLPPILLRKSWDMFVVPALVFAGVPLLVLLASRTYEQRDWFVVYVIALALLTCLALGRSIFVGLENSSLFHLSVTDPLTGLYNRRFFFSRLADEMERAERYDEQMSLVTIDVDAFAEVNRRLGHTAGERLLRQIASLLTSRSQRGWIIARVGGDDFGVIMPETSAVDASVVAQGLLDVIEIASGAAPGSVSASAGIAAYPQHAEDPETLFRLSEGALYQAKRAGRHRVVCYQDDRVPDLTADERIERLTRENRLSSVQALSAAMDAKDAATQLHSRSVSDLARAVALHLQLPAETVERTATGALLHEVGSIGTPDDARGHNGLSEGEWELARSYNSLAQRILSASNLTDLTPVVRSRHEWWDGTGRPDGLAGNEIPVESRILAACHFYESAIAGGQHRRPVGSEDARKELLAGTGSQFDPAVVSALLEVLEADEATAQD